MINSIILAGGKGTRMKTNLPKCAYPLLKKPMISYILSSLEKSICEKNIVVLGYKREVLEPLVLGNLVCYQEEQLGTAHACKMALGLLTDGISIILPGDTPLIDTKLIDDIINHHINKKNVLTVGTMKVEDPFGYGRIIYENGNLSKIVEEKEATMEEKKINEVNTGIMVCNNKELIESINMVKNDNLKHEYYLTDIVSILNKTCKVGSFLIVDNYKLMGINDLYTLSKVEEVYTKEINKKHMINGVNLINPNSISIGPDVIIGQGTTIYPNTILMGNTIIGSNSIVGPNSEIENSIIGDNVKCTHSVVFDSEIKEKSTVGPFVHLRMNTVIGVENRIGNFVEMKNSTTGNKTHVVHLSYVGDTECGDSVNFGCGVVTCNYDGKKKHKTVIGDNIFIGCNTNLVAPVEVGNGSYIAAGSTITENVPENAFAIARERQITKENYVKKMHFNKNEK